MLTEKNFLIEQSKTRFLERELKRKEIKERYEKERQELEEQSKESALGWIFFLYSKCTWRGGVNAEDALRFGQYIWNDIDRCVTIHLNNDGIFFQSRNGKMTRLEDINLNFVNLLSLGEYINNLLKTRP